MTHMRYIGSDKKSKLLKPGRRYTVNISADNDRVYLSIDNLLATDLFFEYRNMEQLSKEWSTE